MVDGKRRLHCSPLRRVQHNGTLYANIQPIQGNTRYDRIAHPLGLEPLTSTRDLDGRRRTHFLSVALKKLKRSQAKAPRRTVVYAFSSK